MALEVIWSPQAIATFEEVIEHLQTNWTEKEIKIFVQKSSSIIDHICLNPKMYQESARRK